jgi:glycolate oxidase FAD binding subunit
LTTSVVGIEPARVLAPANETELETILREANSERSGIVVTTNATKLDFGAAPTRLDVRLELDQLPTTLQHSAGDLVVIASANLGFEQLRETLAKAGQRLSIDEVVPGSSVGGVVATALSGPLRLRFGSVRDMLIGVRFVRADGQRAKAGGKVVKNVAGYDVSKLLCGSQGTLAVLTECIFRLHPIPRRQITISARLPAEAVARSAQAIAQSNLDVAAIECDLEADAAPMISVLVEGSPEGATRRATAVAQILSADQDAEAVTQTVEPPPWWGVLPGQTVVKVTFAPGSAGQALLEAARCTAGRGLVRGSLAVGTLTIGLPESSSAEELRQTLEALRRSFSRLGGTAQLLRGAPAQKVDLDLYGPVPGLDLMERVKDQFDPNGILGPGRFVGGW